MSTTSGPTDSQEDSQAAEERQQREEQKRQRAEDSEKPPTGFLGSFGFCCHLVMTNSLPWKITMLLIGKPSISMGHLYHGYVK